MDRQTGERAIAANQGTRRVSIALIAFAGLAAATAHSAEPPLSPNALERLADFCTNESAFGQAFGIKPARILGSTETFNTVLDTVPTPPGWAPFTKIEVQRTPRTGVVFRVYGTARFDTPEAAKSALSAMTEAMQAKGFALKAFPDAASFELKPDGHRASIEGFIEVEGGVVTARCAVKRLVDQAMHESAGR
jgi:hypothetical protein